MEETKKPWQSKTVVVNAIIGLCGAVALFLPVGAEVQTWMGAHAGEIAMVWGVLNIVLRLVTKDKIGLYE